MGRPAKEVDLEMMLDMLDEKELPKKVVASELGISVPTLSSRIAEMQKKQGLLLQYRAIQALHLTELQARVLEAITPEKINEAPLRDLVASFKILKDKELTIEGKPSEIKGLVAHLLYIEKQEAALRQGLPLPEEPCEEAVFDDDPREEPSLESLDQNRF